MGNILSVHVKVMPWLGSGRPSPLWTMAVRLLFHSECCSGGMPLTVTHVKLGLCTSTTTAEHAAAETAGHWSITAAENFNRAWDCWRAQCPLTHSASVIHREMSDNRRRYLFLMVAPLVCMRYRRVLVSLRKMPKCRVSCSLGESYWNQFLVLLILWHSNFKCAYKHQFLSCRSSRGQ